MRPLPDDLRRALADDGHGLTLLVVRLGAFGDILRTLPAVRLLRFALPDARIDWACDDRWASFVARHPDLDDIVPVPREDLDAALRRPSEWPSAAGLTVGLRRSLRAPRYGLVLEFHGNLRSGVIGALTGAPVRLGFTRPQSKEANRFFTTHRVGALPLRTSRMERNLSLVGSLGVPTTTVPGAGLAADPYAEAAAEELAGARIGAGAPFAVINPGASARQAYKKPPTPLLARAATALARRGVRSLVTWGPGEEPDAEALVRLAGDVAQLAPRTGLEVLASLLRRAAILVSGDTGPLHLGCAVGCPVVAIYGPTDPVVNAPWGVPFARVVPRGRAYTGLKRRDRAEGFDGVAPEDVESAVAEILDRPEVRERMHAGAS